MIHDGKMRNAELPEQRRGVRRCRRRASCWFAHRTCWRHSLIFVAGGCAGRCCLQRSRVWRRCCVWDIGVCRITGGIAHCISYTDRHSGYNSGIFVIGLLTNGEFPTPNTIRIWVQIASPSPMTAFVLRFLVIIREFIKHIWLIIENFIGIRIDKNAQSVSVDIECQLTILVIR